MDKLPPEVNNNLKAIHIQAESFLKSNESRASEFSSSIVLDSSGVAHSHTISEGSAYVYDHKIENKPLTDTGTRESTIHQSTENGLRSPKMSPARPGNDGGTEILEQFEPGVYVTLVLLPGGTKIFKRVRFSKRRFGEQQAEDCENKNKERVIEKYNHQNPGTSSTNPPTLPSADEEDAASSSQS
ncbi:putative brevis radix (BRX) domain-containing protein [Dioscorea sansibarensis]